MTKHIAPLSQILKKEKIQIIIGILLTLITISSHFILMIISGWFISYSGYLITATYSVALQFNYFYPAAYIRGLFIIKVLSRYWERVSTHDTTFKIITDIRIWIYKKILPITPEYLMLYKSGDLLHCLTNDVKELDNLYIRIILPSLSALFIMITSTILFSYVSIKISLVTIIMTSTSSFIIPFIIHKISKKLSSRITLNTARIKTNITEYMSYLEISKIFDGGKLNIKRIKFQSRKFCKYQKKLSIYRGFGNCLTNIVMGINIIFILWYTIILMQEDKINGSYIVAIFLGILIVFETTKQLPKAYQYLGKILTSMNRIVKIVNNTPSINFKQKSSNTLKKSQNIKFENINFSYNEKHFIFKNFNLSIEAKEKVAIIGKTGIGKSTLINLLVRFWEPQKGNIFIGNNNIQELKENYLRNLITVIQQDAHIFNSNIRNNLLIANPKATDKMIWEALEIVELKTFVDNLPKRLNTWTGEFGKYLSKGQQKRLSLARAIIREAPILICDEPTEGVDKITENKIFSNLKTVISNKTFILITHNPNLLINVDNIIKL